MTTIDQIELLIEEKSQLEKEIQLFEDGIEANKQSLKRLMDQLNHLFEKHAEETKV